MKKTIAILLVLVIGMVGVFAATDLNLTTTVAKFNAFKITAADHSSHSYNDTFIGAYASDNVATIGVNSSGLTAATYLTMATNDTAGFTVQITNATKMTIGGSGTGSAIDYTIAGGSNTPGSWNTAATSPAAFDVMTVNATASGAEVTSTALTVTLDSVSYNNAEATETGETYLGTVTFTIKSNG